MMANELIHITNTYFSNENSFIYVDSNDSISKNSLSKVIEFLPSLKQFNYPDLYSRIENEILFIEHFEFDSSKRTNKGSKERQQIALIDERNEKKIKSMKNENLVIHNKLKNNNHFDHYKNNLLDTFNKHYRKILNYKSHLSHEEKADKISNIKSSFFIEDVSKLNNYAMFNDKPQIINIFYAEFFLSHIKEYHKNLDYLFFGLVINNNPFLYFMDLNALEIYVQNQVIVNEENYIPLETNITSGLMSTDVENLI